MYLRYDYSAGNALVIGVVIAATAIAYFRFLRSSTVQKRFSIVDVLLVTAGASSTAYLSIHLELGPVIAASIIGLLASFVRDFNKNSESHRQTPTAIYCGAFVGMSTFDLASNAWFILMSGLLAGILYTGTKGFLDAYGGKSGSIAFGGVLFTLLIFQYAV